MDNKIREIRRDGIAAFDKEEIATYKSGDLRNNIRNIEKRSREEIIADPKTPNLFRQLMRINLDEVEEELTSRAHRAGYDNMNNRQVVNAFSDNVIVINKNGDDVVINNWKNLADIKKWENIQKQQKGATMKPFQHIQPTTNEDVEWDD